MGFSTIFASEIKTILMSLLYYMQYFFSSKKHSFFAVIIVKNKLKSRAFAHTMINRHVLIKFNIGLLIKNQLQSSPFFYLKNRFFPTNVKSTNCKRFQYFFREFFRTPECCFYVVRYKFQATNFFK